MPDTPTADEILRQSVTQGELSTVRNGAILNIMVPFVQGYTTYPLPPEPPPFWSYRRDIVMRSTIYQEAMWAAAVSICITKASSKSFEVSGPVALRVRKAQEMLLRSDGRKVGWTGFLSKHLRDFLTTDNGAFVEIVRASKAYGSRIVGLKHLDSLRCTRTGDPRVPVLYRDRVGRIHELKDHQVLMFSDMPDPSESYFGVGLCAASRAYSAIYKLGAIEKYLREKVAGLRPLAIYIVNGVLDKQLRDSVSAARDNEVARGLVAYMGAVIIGIPDETPPALVTIPLAELPDRFNRKEEFDIAVLTYADNLGLDPQDLQPLSSGSLGQGAQSVVLHDKAIGKGLVGWTQQFTHSMNEWVLGEETTFVFTERDYRDLQQKADISKARTDIATARITAQMTTPAQEVQLLVSLDELPKDFLTTIPVPGDTLGDSEKADPNKDSPSAPKKGDLAANVPSEVQEQPAKGMPGGAPEKVGVTPAVGARNQAKADSQQQISEYQNAQKLALSESQTAQKIAAAQAIQAGKPPKASSVSKDPKYHPKLTQKRLPTARKTTKDFSAAFLGGLEKEKRPGNWGHKGRPGVRGGSLPKDVDITEKTKIDPPTPQEVELAKKDLEAILAVVGNQTVETGKSEPEKDN
jgi:hypothetical protein